LITDLATHPDAHHNIDTDVLIIGAGIAGLVMADRLRRNKTRVVAIESGGLKQNTDTHPLNRVDQLGSPYQGAALGRYRCLGGTSTRWGGALIPFLENDLRERPYLDLPSFPIDMDSVSPYLRDVETLFQLDAGSYEEDFVADGALSKYIPTGDLDFHARFAKWPSFKNRNVASLLRDRLDNDRDVQILLNSTATTFDVDRNNGRMISVTGRHSNGRSVTVTAKNFVICAGAIESTRLLLLLDRDYDGRVFEGCNALGHYFYDHISTHLASIHTQQAVKLNRMAGFRFIGSTMRSLRFELSAVAQRRERVSSAFGHISVRTKDDTGFDFLRRFLRSRQSGSKIPLDLLFRVTGDLPYLARLAFWRLAYRQLLWPTPASYELHVVAEQLPRFDNYIALSSEMDWFGLPLAAINWRIAPSDLETFAAFKRLFDQFWIRHKLQAVGDLAWSKEAKSDSFDMTSQDVFHPGGTTRMGVDRHLAVIDANLGVFSIPNLWTASTATFPSGGGANPTLMLIMLSMRLADHLAKTSVINERSR
jgi:choline dehydrogenase-like flavoprotein